MDRNDVKNALKKYVSDMSIEEFSRLFINEVSAIEEFYKLCHDIKSGNTISLLFNPHRLNIITEASVTRTSNPMSIYQSLKDAGNDKYTEKIDGMARLYLYNLESGVNNPFYCTIQRGFNGVAYVNEFPPFVARTIYKTYGNKDGMKILDPCAGWGGRMIGAASIPNTTYVACEPSSQTYDGLIKLGEWLKTLQPSFNYTVYKLPYEEFKTDEKFDIALTSPPYFNTEHYSEELTNSMNKFSEFDCWVDGFYKPLILNTMSYLRDGGKFILNIGDRKYPLSDNLFRIATDSEIYCTKIKNYLSNIGDDGEKFYCLSYSKDASMFYKPKSLFGE